VKQSSDRQDPGRYVSPIGGHAGAGETEDEALKREAFEECGLKDFEYKLIGKKIYNRYVLNRQENHYFVVYEIHSDQGIVLNEEGESFKVFAEEALKKALKDDLEIFGMAFHFVIQTFYPKLLL